jgi:superfamily II DNA or RNA helicase
MPRIFDNINLDLLPALRQTLELTNHADFCVGYFNLRGWKAIDRLIEAWKGGPGHQCRLLVGMQRPPQEVLRQSYSLLPKDDEVSNQYVIRLKRRLAEEFKTQLTYGAPSDEDEAGLRRLAAQLKSGKVLVKLFLRHPLHAKLYLCFRNDPINPIVGYLGSSNLTISGLSSQGELNVDILDHDASQKLAVWFEERWNDRWCVDITNELIQVIEESWARLEILPPYQIYVKMAYHLAEEARAGLSEFTIPADIRNTLLEFQSAAVKIAARHLEKRGGVILGDVVGLGKTLMATALARVFEEPPHGLESLIVCPKNLVGMWEDYAHRYRLRAKVVSIAQAQSVLPELRRYRIVVIDESHNLRNRDGRRWAVIRDYIRRNGSLCILLSATPYNKSYLDIANQLRLFLPADRDVGIRPEIYIRQECGGSVVEFTRRHQYAVNCIGAFEKSEHADDWRELMRLFMVRRTRSFVENNYAFSDCPKCGAAIAASQAGCPKCKGANDVSARRFLVLENGNRFYFPKRLPKALTFHIHDNDPDDQYAKLYSESVVDNIRRLHLPRYGLANYLKPSLDRPHTQKEDEITKNLSRAGKRLIGFCRTNLFKRLESSGYVFLLSVRRHILRNFIYLHALENNLPLPIGTQDTALFDTRTDDADNDPQTTGKLFENGDGNGVASLGVSATSRDDFAREAAEAYMVLARDYQKLFDWLNPDLFVKELAKHLREDAKRLISILKLAGQWSPEKDQKLAELERLLTTKHPDQKVVVFTQFADTVHYLADQLNRRQIKQVAAVTGQTDDPSSLAQRFSPDSNDARDTVAPEKELRVLIATDVLSEGQNLQDSAIIVNFDLPWAIIRLIQRAGRVDRIGQKAEEILCYSFLPAEGVERLIRLRERVRQRLQENAEVVGTDEAFFEDEQHDHMIRDLFTEKSGILDDPEDNEVDLASLAYQVWRNATDADPSLKKTIPNLPNVVFSTKPVAAVLSKQGDAQGAAPPTGVMVYVRNTAGNDALAWLDEQGNTVTESQHAILTAAACLPSTPALPRLDQHHRLVRKAVEGIQAEQSTIGGQLGRPSSARRRVYERLKDYADSVKKDTPLFDSKQLHRVIDAIYERPLTESARDLLNRELRAGISDDKLVDMVLALHEEDRLCTPGGETETREPQIICSLGIRGE